MAGGAPGFRFSTFTKLVIYSGAALLFLPKINLIAIDGFRAGLRIDDFVIALVVLYLMVIGQATPLFRYRLFGWGFGFIAVSWFSHIVGGGLVLFSLRMMEYLCLAIIGFALGQVAKDAHALPKFLFAYLLANFALCIGQATGVVGGIGIGGFTNEFGGRVFGLCNGPWELGIVICFLYGYLASSDWVRASKWRRQSVFPVCGIILILTAARTPLAIFLMLSLLRITRHLPRSTQLMSAVGMPILALIGLYFGVAVIKTDNYAVERLRDFLNPSNLGELWDYAVNFRPSLSYTEVSHEDLSLLKDAKVDASMAIRLYIFSYMASSYYFGGVLVWLFGLGHGFSGPSTDLGMLRILCEVGLAGFVCFHMMLWECTKRVPATRLMVVAFLINQFTLDVYVGYKTMFVFFLIVGYELAMRSRFGGGGRVFAVRRQSSGMIKS